MTYTLNDYTDEARDTRVAKEILDGQNALRREYFGQTAILGNIYVLQSLDLVKVGFAKNLRKRISALQSANPYKLTLLCWFAPATIGHEKWLHKELKTFRSHREWFYFSSELESKIFNIQFPELYLITPDKLFIPSHFSKEG